MARFCLNMIVKNESARVTRAFDSVVQFITAAVIMDTGSTDDTIAITKKYFKDHNIPCVVNETDFKDWSTARNTALSAARYAIETCLIPRCDYLLLMDADMEIRVTDPVAFAGYTIGLSYDMYQVAGALHYQNRRLLRMDAPGGYLGVTHEYLDVATSGCVPESVAFFIDHADGANRPEKFKRDIRLLKDGLRAEPDNARYYFYLAQSYRDAGNFHDAAKWYKRRVDAGGWDEEVWSAQVSYAHCLRDMGREADFIRNLLIAYNMRPTRAETLFDLANFYRVRGDNATSLVFSEAGLQIPKSDDALFVNDYVYEAGLAEEYSICAFYIPSKRKNGFVVTDHLSLKPGPYANARALARHNMYWYLPTLKESCPSFVSRKIDFTPPENWTALNPSIALFGTQLACIIRTVNYRIDDNGCYIIQGTDGTANNTNPINTRNYLAWLGADPMSETHPIVTEIYNPVDMPCEFPLVIGFEDMRLINWKGGMWGSATMRQCRADGLPEQVLAQLVPAQDAYVITNVKTMDRQPRECQKNWAPISAGDKLSFLYRPGHVVDIHGDDKLVHPTKLDTGQISGGSQLIPFENGWLSIHHEAQFVPGRQVRHYYHRFLYHNQDFQLIKVSRPFVFEDKQIEFCAGMCWHPVTANKLVISYGSRDAEARIATVASHEVSKLLWFGSNGGH